MFPIPLPPCVAVQDVGSYGESGDEADKEEEDEECDEGEGRKLDLGVLSKEPHPCLAEGHFSVFNSPRVGPATVQDVSYNIDMDGFVVLSK